MSGWLAEDPVTLVLVCALLASVPVVGVVVAHWLGLLLGVDEEDQ